MSSITMRHETMASAPDSEDARRRQRARSVAIGLGLGALVVIFYVATLVRLGPNAFRKDGFGDAASKKNVIIQHETKERGGEAACKRAGTC
jgi:hypothetical protein